MGEDASEVVGDWEVESDGGQIHLTFVHAASMREYLSGKGQTTNLTLTLRQAIALSDALREEISKPD